MIEPGSIVKVETIRREVYLGSGAQIFQLTSAPVIHSNIYCEVSYMDPSSRYVIFLIDRETYTVVPQVEVWRADLEGERRYMTNVCQGVVRGGVAVSPDQRFFYCVRPGGPNAFEVIRTEIATLQQKSVTIEGAGPGPNTMGTVGPDNRTYMYSMYLGKGRFGIVKLDLETGAHAVVYERGADMCNAHPQLEPRLGRDLLVQHNRGAELNEHGHIIKLVGDEGATLFLIDIDGSNVRELPVGKPYTWPVQGHQCWAGMSGQILFTVTSRYHGQGGLQEMIDRGTMRLLRPGDSESRLVAKGYYFDHPNVSKDGRFFACDSPEDSLVLVGSIATGKNRILCETGTSFGSAQYTHSHPYFSPDKRWVIYNSDRTGIPQVYAAQVPDGLLEELDTA